MKHLLLFAALFSAVLLFNNCRTKKFASNDHGVDKALKGSPFNANKPIKSLTYKLSSSSAPATDIEMKFYDNFYDASYKLGDKSYYSSINMRDAEPLHQMLGHATTSDYYRDNYSSNSALDNEWSLIVKQDDSEFIMNGKNADTEKYPILKGIIGYFNDIFEFTDYTAPFPNGHIVSFSYSHKGSMRPGGPEWNLTRLDDGSYKLTYLDDSRVFMGEEPIKKEKICDSKINDDLIQIMKDGKIQNYKSQYNNYGVFDGSSWSMHVRFSEGKSISSGGYMAGPRDDSGLMNTLRYLENLMDLK